MIFISWIKPRKSLMFFLFFHNIIAYKQGRRKSHGTFHLIITPLAYTRHAWDDLKSAVNRARIYERVNGFHFSPNYCESIILLLRRETKFLCRKISKNNLSLRTHSTPKKWNQGIGRNRRCRSIEMWTLFCCPSYGNGRRHHNLNEPGNARL